MHQPGMAHAGMAYPAPLGTATRSAPGRVAAEPPQAVLQRRGVPAADAGQRRLADLARQGQGQQQEGGQNGVHNGGRGNGLPEPLREGIERLSGLAMDDVRVHHDSPEPARLDALAFAQGRDIHLAPGQEQHLPHEAWHVVQQAQGRVRPGLRLAYGAPVNNDPALEREADAMGQAALALGGGGSGKAPAALRALPAGLAPVVQRVGGTKIAIELDKATPADDPLLATLVSVFTGYKKEIRDTKAKAKTAFKGQEASIDEQTKFSDALKAAEMDYAELVKRLTDTRAFKINDKGVIRRKVKAEGAQGQTTVIGRIHKGSAAFQKTADKADAVVQDVYRKFDPSTKDGLKDKTEYIQVQGRMLRRLAYRGITPLEIDQIEKGGTVNPLFHTAPDRAKAQSGMHFDGGFGNKRKANDDKLDLSYMRSFSKVTSITPEMHGFVHGRKGVGKFFSLRSTPADITSNHGASFSDFGEIELDLAMVPESDFVFHYADGGGSALQSGVAPSDVTDKTRHTKEVQRARESVLRNREVILKAYPAAAVRWKRKHSIKESDVQARGYSDGFNAERRPDFVLYATAYDLGHASGVANREAWFLGQGHGRNDKQRRSGWQPNRRMQANSSYMAGYKAGYDG
ncbi:eCIS core domain-containing protein [Aquabacterium sp. OR-4]|uniref:eCIS core domain-containing protein n=1 Tax=Aquabacterium sp. OR-4 TaxID=2978127 RepID=UPI0021B3CA2D|nr:DUF4157 domain-containing protein [Aquabacterium sp. OR-4]MDT7837954.1 DUF4157 domain-containing protein [Aquabacterium sp. OR-4]